MRWSERRTAVRSTFEDDFHTSTPSDARSRPPSLILFSLDLIAMRRVIRPGPRPFIAASIIFGSLMIILPLLIGFRTGRWGDAGQFALVFLGIGAAFCLFVSGNRIVVTDDYLDYRVSFIPKGRVYFQNVVASVPVTLAERDWPLSLTIFGRDPDRPEMVLLLKPWHKADVDWLLSLPQLKVQSTP